MNHQSEKMKQNHPMSDKNHSQDKHQKDKASAKDCEESSCNKDHAKSSQPNHQNKK